MDLTPLGLPAFFTDPWWLVAFAILPPLIVLGLWEGRTVRHRRVALGVVQAGPERMRARLAALVRALIFSALLLALAGLQIVRAAGPQGTVYLVDVSASVSNADQAAALAYVRQALADTAPDARAAVIYFAAQPIVARAPDATGPLPPVPLTLPRSATDVAAAIRLGLGLLPDAGPRRLVLLSDGLDTGGDAASAAAEAAASGVPISVVPLHAGASQDVAVDSVSAPGRVAIGQAFEVIVQVSSATAEGAELRVYQDATLLADRQVSLLGGTNTFRIPATAGDQGFHIYRAEIAAANDQWTQNDQAAGYTVVSGPPRVLIVAGSPDDGDPLRVALTAAHVDAQVITPDAVPHTLDGLAAYDTVVLANVAAPLLGADTEQALQSYVRDLGRGLVMVGGELSFGAGGYLGTAVEAALPVSMQVRSPQSQADVALALVVDKSGSMGRCHCGSTGAFRSTNVQSAGESKVDIAKQAILKAAATLAPTDRIGVVAFDTLARWVVQMQPLAQVPDLSGEIAGIQADGDTNLLTGLRAATTALEETPAQVKHMILLSDGWTQGGSYNAIVDEMRRNNITLSAIADGSGSDNNVLKTLAQDAGGRYYSADDSASVPQLFLKETVLTTGAYFVETPTVPSLIRAGPILQGLDTAALPPLSGYNSTTPRDTAQVALAAPNGDPILAQWQYGLGRAVAWTPDMKGRWATAWVQWAGFAQFAAQLVDWTLPRSNIPALDATAAVAGGQAQIAVDAHDPTGAARTGLPTTVHIDGPNGSVSEVPLTELRPGHYTGQVVAGAPGAYQAVVSQQTLTGTVVATTTLGLVVPYPAEYRLPASPDAGLAGLRALAAVGGGRVLDLGQPVAAAPLGSAPPTRVPAWPFLLTVALLLFPVDVAVRRLIIRLPRRPAGLPPRAAPSDRPPAG